jgi:hypothetical protein
MEVFDVAPADRWAQLHLLDSKGELRWFSPDFPPRPVESWEAPASEWRNGRGKRTEKRIPDLACFSSLLVAHQTCLDLLPIREGFDYQRLDLRPAQPDYTLLNPLAIENVLDAGRSVFSHRAGTSTVLSVKEFAFHEEAFGSRNLFTVTESPLRIYVTGAFVNAVNANRLKGLRFTPLWRSDTGPVRRIPYDASAERSTARRRS